MSSIFALAFSSSLDQSVPDAFAANNIWFLYWLEPEETTPVGSNAFASNLTSVSHPKI